MNEWTLTGRHVFAITAGAFAIIIGVNITLAVQAVKTFPGLEVKNSYVASQAFDKNKTAHLALGWDVSADVQDDMLILSVRDANDMPVMLQGISATFGRATHVKDDQTPDFTYSDGQYLAPVTVGRGNWNLRLEAFAPDGTPFQQRIVIWIK
jgi:nitrogen fixation protein FixH